MAGQIRWWKNVTMPLIQLCTELPAPAGSDTIQTMITIATRMPRTRCNNLIRLQALPERRRAGGRARVPGQGPRHGGLVPNVPNPFLPTYSEIIDADAPQSPGYAGYKGYVQIR